MGTSLLKRQVGRNELIINQAQLILLLWSFKWKQPNIQMACYAQIVLADRPKFKVELRILKEQTPTGLALDCPLVVDDGVVPTSEVRFVGREF